MQNLVPRVEFESFQTLFETLNNHPSLTYVVQRSVHELKNKPTWFKGTDVDVLVNDYYCFKAVTGARSPVGNRHIRENDNGYFIQSTILVGGVEIRFDIRYTGDRYLDPNWELVILNRKTPATIGGFEVFVPSPEDELYSLLYHIFIQKKSPAKSKHLKRVYQLQGHKSKLRELYRNLKSWMKQNSFSFTKPKDPRVGFKVNRKF
jgi:hypothetical protein